MVHKLEQYDAFFYEYCKNNRVIETNTSFLSLLLSLLENMYELLQIMHSNFFVLNDTTLKTEWTINCVNSRVKYNNITNVNPIVCETYLFKLSRSKVGTHDLSMISVSAGYTYNLLTWTHNDVHEFNNKKNVACVEMGVLYMLQKIKDIMNDPVCVPTPTNSTHVSKPCQQVREVIDEEQIDLHDPEPEIVDEKEKILKKEAQMHAEKKQKRINVYMSDKNFTYPKIYADFFEKNILNWTNMPPLFVSKFIVLLYMDGKNTEGKTVRKSLFDRDDAFEIYEMLSNIISNDELPSENEVSSEYYDFIENFVEQLPTIHIVTPEEIMGAMNGTSKNKQIFDNDECSQDDVYEMETNNLFGGSV